MNHFVSRRFWQSLARFAVAMLSGIGLVSCGAAQEDPVTWDDHALPVFKARCASCHNTNRKSGDLDLTSFSGIMAGGASGSVLEPGNPDGSYLYRLITHEDEPSMPPGGTKIPDAEIDVVAKWIAGGVLENRGSKPRGGRKKSAIAGSATAFVRPESVALFPRLELEPVRRTDRAGVVTALAAHPWGTTLAVGAPGQVLLYDLADQSLKGVLPFPEGQPQVLRFSRNGAILLAGGGRDGQSGRVVLWDVSRGDRIGEIGDELDTVLAADISSDHRLVALGGPEKIVRVWNVADGKLKYELRKHTDWITAVEFSPDGVLLATGDRNGGLFVWHAPTGNEYLALNGHTAAITAVPWRLDSNLLVSASLDGTVRAWELENGGQVKSINAHGGGVAGAVYDRDNQLATVGRDGQAKLWNPAGDLVRTFVQLGDVGTSAAICADAAKVIAGDWQGNVIAWNLADESQSWRLDANPPTLRERLAGSEAALTTATDREQEMAGVFEAAKGRLQDVEASLASARKDAGEAETRLNELRARRKELEEQISATDARLEQLRAEASQLERVLPELEALVTQAGHVAELAAEDGQLAAARDSLQEKLAASRARATAIGEEMGVAQQQRDEAASAMQAVEAEIPAAEQMLGPLEATLAALGSERETVAGDVARADQDVAAAAAARIAADQDVQRWRQEIGFVEAVGALREQIAAAGQSVDAAAEVAERLKAELEAARQRAAGAEAAVQEAEQRRAEVERQLDLLRGIER